MSVSAVKVQNKGSHSVLRPFTNLRPDILAAYGQSKQAQQLAKKALAAASQYQSEFVPSGAAAMGGAPAGTALGKAGRRSPFMDKENEPRANRSVTPLEQRASQKASMFAAAGKSIACAQSPKKMAHEKVDHKAQDVLRVTTAKGSSKENIHAAAQIIPANVAAGIQGAAVGAAGKVETVVSAPPKSSGVATAAAAKPDAKKELSIWVPNKSGVDDEYTRLRSLAEGSYGRVRSAVQNVFDGKKMRKTDVVLKMSFTVNSCLRRLPTDLENRASLAQQRAKLSWDSIHTEYQAHQDLAGVRNIIELVGGFNHNKSDGVCTVLVFPRYPHDLKVYLQQREKSRLVLDFQDFRRIVGEGLDTLIDLKKRGFVLQDIKPANLVFDPAKKAVKFIDLGGVRSTADSLEKGGQRTPDYMAIEWWIGAPCNHLLDVWSFGVTLFEIFTGKRFVYCNKVAHLFTGQSKFADYADVAVQLVAQQIGFPPTKLVEAAKHKELFFKSVVDGYEWKVNLLAPAQPSRQGTLQWVKDVREEAARRGLSSKMTEALVSFLGGMIAYERQEPEALAGHPFLKLAEAETATVAAKK